MPQNLPLPQNEAWTCVRTRTSNNGLAVMPTAGPWPQFATVVALHGGIETDTVTGVCVSIGAPPTIVSPNSLLNHPNRLYLGGSQSGALPCLTFGGVKIYAVTFAYSWAILSPEGLDQDLPLGVQPWDSDPANSEYLPASKMNAYLLNDTVYGPLNGQQENLPMLLRQIEDER